MSLMGWDWVHLVLRPLFGPLYQPQMIDYDDCGAICGMRIGRGNWSTRRKATPVLLCPLPIPQELTRARTRAAAVGRRRLTVWDLDHTHLHQSSALRRADLVPVSGVASKQIPQPLKYLNILIMFADNRPACSLVQWNSFCSLFWPIPPNCSWA
jgi:hypothetical protein